MTMGSNRLRFSSCPRERQPGMGSENDPSDVTILNMAVDTQSLFRRRAAGLSINIENRATDDVFRVLLSKANRELANLLRDVRTESHSALPGETRSQQVGDLLMRAVRCAAKQYMLQAELGNLALTDELTGLYNRRGFMVLGERQLRLGRRSGRGMLLFVMDVDRLKHINDSFGHVEGDNLLKRAAGALRETFRDSDVVARLGGDEFAVLAIEAAGHSEATIRARLFERLKSISTEQGRYEISLSLGVAQFDPRNRASIADLMAKADHAMYQQKRRRSSALFGEGSQHSNSIARVNLGESPLFNL
jgi:diguanylate cyclase (GGDEF)-like protein